MPLGLVRTEEFDSQLSRYGKSSSNETTIELVHGRGDKKETPEILRELIASEAIAGASAKDLSRQFNVSESSVSAYKNGATSTSTYNRPDEQLEKANDKTRDEITGAAKTKLIQALEAINFGDKIKPNIASAVARDMSTIMKNTSNDPSVVINNNRTVVFAPRMKEEDEYEVIDVKEN